MMASAGSISIRVGDIVDTFEVADMTPSLLMQRYALYGNDVLAQVLDQIMRQLRPLHNWKEEGF